MVVDRSSSFSAKLSARTENCASPSTTTVTHRTTTATSSSASSNRAQHSSHASSTTGKNSHKRGQSLTLCLPTSSSIADCATTSSDPSYNCDSESAKTKGHRPTYFCFCCSSSSSSSSSNCGSVSMAKKTAFSWLYWSSLTTMLRSVCSIKLLVLLVLCLQNSMFTILRRYSQGVLRENYSKYEVLLAGEAIKMVFSAFMIQRWMNENRLTNNNNPATADVEGGSSTGIGDSSSDSKSSSVDNIHTNLQKRLWYLVGKSHKMLILALIYGAMNILSFVSLRNIGAGLFTVFAQCKILTTATFSTWLLQRQYSATKWRALLGLMFGVLLFSEPIWRDSQLFSVTTTTTTATTPTSGEEHSAATDTTTPAGNPLLGTVAVLTEVTLSGFASIYFEKVIKLDPLQLNIWERNFQLALTSFPVYLAFIIFDQRSGRAQSVGMGGGWSMVTWVVAALGAAGGLLVALSIKYGDAILKTLATTGAIVLSSVLDYVFLNGPLTPTMVIAGVQVILSIFNYTFDMTPPPPPSPSPTKNPTTDDNNTNTTGTTAAASNKQSR